MTPRRDFVASLHPAVRLLLFGQILVFCFALQHPVCLLAALGTGAAYLLTLQGRAALRPLGWMFALALVAAAINAAFSHAGVTILCYLPSGNPLTRESLVYSAVTAAMVAAALCWFACLTAAMPSDAYLELFGRVAPALSLLLSMTLRFVPRLHRQLGQMRDAQRALGQRTPGRGPVARLRRGAALLSGLLTWSLENAVETADSMKARGYGLPGRTAASVCRWTGRDSAVLAWALFCAVDLSCGIAAGALRMTYFPAISWPPVAPLPLSFLGVHLALCLTPLIGNAKEARKWRRLQSTI